MGSEPSPGMNRLRSLRALSSKVKAAAAAKHFAGHVIGHWRTEEHDAVCGFLGRPQTSQRANVLDGLEHPRLNTDGDGPALDVDARSFPRDRLDQSRLDQPEADSVDVHVVPAPFLR